VGGYVETGRGPPGAGGSLSVIHSGEFSLGARVVAGLFSQTHEHPEWTGREVLDIVRDAGLARQAAMTGLARYGLQGTAWQRFETLSGGQQARLQVLLLELRGANLLLLDELTDNLDLESAEALEAALEEFVGTVVAVTHDRWLMRGFERFLVFDYGGSVRESMELDLVLPLLAGETSPGATPRLKVLTAGDAVAARRKL
jgi:ATPase subunit of ABC transporter with duplicated ATPase domains